jgi:hypothetical protein
MEFAWLNLFRSEIKQDLQNVFILTSLAFSHDVFARFAHPMMMAVKKLLPEITFKHALAVGPFYRHVKERLDVLSCADDRTLLYYLSGEGCIVPGQVVTGPWKDAEGNGKWVRRLAFLFSLQRVRDFLRPLTPAEQAARQREAEAVALEQQKIEEKQRDQDGTNQSAQQQQKGAIRENSGKDEKEIYEPVQEHDRDEKSERKEKKVPAVQPEQTNAAINSLDAMKDVCEWQWEYDSPYADPVRVLWLTLDTRPEQIPMARKAFAKMSTELIERGHQFFEGGEFFDPTDAQIDKSKDAPLQTDVVEGMFGRFKWRWHIAPNENPANSSVYVQVQQNHTFESLAALPRAEQLRVVALAWKQVPVVQSKRKRAREELNEKRVNMLKKARAEKQAKTDKKEKKQKESADVVPWRDEPEMLKELQYYESGRSKMSAVNQKKLLTAQLKWWRDVKGLRKEAALSSKGKKLDEVEMRMRLKDILTNHHDMLPTAQSNGSGSGSGQQNTRKRKAAKLSADQLSSARPDPPRRSKRAKVCDYSAWTGH